MLFPSPAWESLGFLFLLSADGAISAKQDQMQTKPGSKITWKDNSKETGA